MNTDIKEAFKALASEADIAAPICGVVASGQLATTFDLDALCRVAHLPLARRGDIHRALQCGLRVGLFEKESELSWRSLAERGIFETLGMMLTAVKIYRAEIHRDEDLVDIVLTKPPRPSFLERSLENGGYGVVGIEHTRAMFVDMASAAKVRFGVMTPFIDDVGGRTLLDIFLAVAPGVQRQLILRSTEAGLPSGYLKVASELHRLGVEVFDYRLNREVGNGYETFHAKAIVVDGDWCYVGSANLTAASIEYSMELGLAVRGVAASKVSRLFEAIVVLCKPIHHV